MKWHKVLSNNDLNYPFLKKVKADGTAICLVGMDGEVCALSAKCPHAGADISGGWCKDGKLICPFHRYSYNIHTGRGSAGQNDYLPVYPVQMRADGVYVGITSKWEFITKLFNR